MPLVATNRVPVGRGVLGLGGCSEAVGRWGWSVGVGAGLAVVAGGAVVGVVPPVVTMTSSKDAVA